MTERSPAPAAAPARVAGLVLAGGMGRRLGRDKGRLVIHDGLPQVVWAFELLMSLCGAAWVSIRAEQRALEPYRTLPVISDEGTLEGPAAGLLAAWRAQPATAWLVLAVDMPWVDRPMLEALLAARRPDCLATAFRHVDGTPEPLCALWEPQACAALERALVPGRTPSLRRLLELPDATLLMAPAPERLRSINEPADLAAPGRNCGPD